MPTVDVRGVTIFYREAGEGEPVLLIQGLEVDHRGWVQQVPTLKEKYRCISFDNRDIGQSSMLSGTYTTRDMMDDAVGVLDAAGVQRAHVIGFSMGGAVAQEIAINHPERVNRLILIDTFASTSAWFRAMNEGRARIRSLVSLEDYTRANFPTVYTARDYDVPGQIETTIERVLANPNGQPNDAFARQVAAINAHHSADRLGRIAAPTLIICGDEDFLTPPKLSREMHAGIKGSKLVWIAEAGHGVIWTRGPEVNAAIMEFLAS